jgi:hypothetical protein
MHDPTIPRHLAGELRSPMIGRFVDYGDRVLLTDARGRTYSPEYVSIVTGFWGFGEEGTAKLPRPWLYDPAGGVLIEGDKVLIFFLDGKANLPIVMGAARRCAPDEFLPYNYASPEANPNALRARLLALNALGVAEGEVRVKVCDDDKGSVLVQADDHIALERATPAAMLAGVGATERLLLSADGADLAAGLQTLRVTDGLTTNGYGVEPQAAITRTFLEGLLDVLTAEVIPGITLAGGPTTQLAALVAATQAELAAIDGGAYIAGGASVTQRFRTE